MKEKHGMTKSKEYTAWRSMKERCFLPTNAMWKSYGGRGITVCEQWQKSFTCFFNDMGALPFQGAQLDRIDNNGNYEPINCRWVSQQENHQNRQDSIIVEFNGKTQSLVNWGKELNIPYNILIQRLRRDKWTIEQTLTTPRSRNRNGRNKIHLRQL